MSGTKVEPKNRERMSLYNPESEVCQKCLCSQCTLDCYFDDPCFGCCPEERDDVETCSQSSK